MTTRKRRPSIGEKAIDTIRDAERNVEHVLTCMWDDLQAWQQDNHYIISGYRPATFSFKKSFASIYYFHNESVNIYTHLLGSVSSILLGLYLYSGIHQRYPTSTRSDILAFTTFFLSASTCLGLSATYHTISNHSHPIAKLGNQLDYLGIIILIVGSFLPTVYYGFLCHPHLIWAYSLMILSLGALCATVTVLPRFRTPKFRPFRAGMFVCLGGSGVIPVLHGISLAGFRPVYHRMGLPWVVIQGGLYVVGAAVYAARIPERFWPGRFDLVGSSHQIFHCFVVAAVLAQSKGLGMAFDWRHKGGDRCG
ncbi:HlyIII-domain-containing protein [Wilcoxina mikolae CBS 423.85]|nr:HlyIII-domain-containing protein [Wilcoxina mikolae CBS 423.85]